jgi:hypothetical protein
MEPSLVGEERFADRFASCGEAKRELFDYIEVFYKRQKVDARRSAQVDNSQHDTFSAREEDRTNGDHQATFLRERKADDQLTAHVCARVNANCGRPS